MENHTEIVVQQIAKYVNSFSDKSLLFNAAMAGEHRTLQQSFTKLCLSWLEHVATPEYPTDLRNEASHEVSELLMKLFREHQSKQGFTEKTLDIMSKPSKHLPLV